MQSLSKRVTKIKKAPPYKVIGWYSEESDPLSKGTLKHQRPVEQSVKWPLVLLSGLGVWTLAFILLRVLSKSMGEIPLFETTKASVRTVSKLLFTQYLWPFEVLTVFLLALIVGIFVLARPEKGETP
ncbi:MAG: NADH-quinone oxidoreductase subunit J [Pseudomonadota bacterium]